MPLARGFSEKPNPVWLSRMAGAVMLRPRSALSENTVLLREVIRYHVFARGDNHEREDASIKKEPGD
jgi:hypothetical protein